PAPAVLESILTLGARTPDHGKLFPWRFVVMGPESRHGIAQALRPLADRQPDPKKAAAVLGKLTTPPISILVLSVPVPGHPVPKWEQELSAGAVCMNLEHAAAAFGFSTSWITDWYSYDTEAVALFGVHEGEQIAGFIHIGTVTEAPLERVRPDVAALTTYLP
ncbi:MAG: nitroreductase, partial [Alphaproteobacteria bacterium]